MVATRRRMMPMMWRTKMAARRISMLTVLEREREREQVRPLSSFLLCRMNTTAGLTPPRLNKNTHTHTKLL